jgi:KaiC/GvpD/RAD55 family RecA-like ATPase
VVKVRLADFTLAGELTLKTGENRLRSAVIDPVHEFAYFGTDTQPGIIVKIRLSDFSRDGALMLNPREGRLSSAVIDATNSFAYFGTGTSPGVVVKVSLSDFTRADALTLNQGENSLRSAMIDTTGSFAYFGTDTDLGIVGKLRLSDFTRVDTLSLNPGEGGLSAGVLDTASDSLYFGTDAASSGTTIIRVGLSNFTRVDAINLSLFEQLVSCSVIDTASGFAYFGTYTDPGIAVKINVRATPTSATIATSIISTSSSVTASAPSYAIFGLAPESFFTAAGVVVIAASSAWLIMRRKQSSRHKPYLKTAQVTSSLQGPMSTQPNISTGYGQLDQQLEGGLPEGYRILLVSPSYDERDLLLRRIIASALSSQRLAVYLTSDLERAKDLAYRYRENFHAFCATQKTPPNQELVHCIPDIENLSNLNISLSNGITDLHLDNAARKIFIVEILSDLLLRHKLLTTRRWLSDFAAKRKSQGFTVLGTLNPFTASKEDTQTLMDFFDGVLEISEKEYEGKVRRFIAIKKMYGRKYPETELLLDKEKLF